MRLHTGPQAEAQAASVKAYAYTIGGHIVLGRDRPARPSRTLAHEIAHALHHEPSLAWREPYETRGVSMDRSALADLSTRGYWMQRTLAAYDLTSDARLSSDAEERDAVLSVVWALRPTPTVRSRQELVVPIAPRALPPPAAAPPGAMPVTPVTPATPAAPTQTPTTIYSIVFEPPAAGNPRPRLTLEHRISGTGAGMTPVAAPTPPAAYVPPDNFSWNAVGFDANVYFAAHPQERAALLNWIENSPSPSFSQLLTAQSTGARGAVTHRGAIHVSGSRSGSDIRSVTYTLVSESTLAATATAPVDYRTHGDAGDADIEAQTHHGAHPLGTVTLPPSTPADEIVPVKVYVASYFQLHTLHSAEVDMLVPIGTGSRNVMYTARFDANANAVVTRIGEAGSGAGLTNINRITVQRARGFPVGGDAAALRSFWASRYSGAPALTSPATATDVEVLAEMDRLLAAGVANAAWFQTVYGIEAMTGSDTSTRLDTAHGVPAANRSDTIDFSTTDLQMLELALQTLTPSELTRLRGIKIGRKTSPIARTGGNIVAGETNQYGFTLRDGANTTVLYFEKLYLNNERLFRGSTAAGALPDVVMNVLHELGHASGFSSGVETAFTTWLTAQRANRAIDQSTLAAPTWYGASGRDEMFPEVWALYHSDPHFLCGQSPLIYAWLNILATTGSPPAATATVAPVASCPP